MNNTLPNATRRVVEVILALFTPRPHAHFTFLSDSDLMAAYDASFGDRKIQAIKMLRIADRGLGLREAKEFIEREVIPYTNGGRDAEITRLKSGIKETIAAGYDPTTYSLHRLAALLDERGL